MSSLTQGPLITATSLTERPSNRVIDTTSQFASDWESKTLRRISLLRRAVVDHRLSLDLRKKAWRSAQNLENLIRYVRGEKIIRRRENEEDAHFPVSAADLHLPIGLLNERPATRGGEASIPWLDALSALEGFPKLGRPSVISITFSVSCPEGVPIGGYVREWAAIEFNEGSAVFTTGIHYYDPSVGGDTISETRYACARGWEAGDLQSWLDALGNFDCSRLEVLIEQ